MTEGRGAATSAAPAAPAALVRLTTDLAEHAFAPRRRAGPRPLIGAEAEFIPVNVETRRVCPVDGGTRSTLGFLRRFGAGADWVEERTAKGAPSFRLPDGGTLTFEPGGQIEYGSAPCSSATALLERLRAAVVPMRCAALDAGIDMLALGIDPETPVERAPLQLRAERYCRMADYFATIGPAGARMMRQTAAFQVSLDFADEPRFRRLQWRVLNAAAPYVVAMFANSARYAGAETGHRSYRAHVWRTVDPRRTGVFDGGGDAAAEYRDFALAAPALLLSDDGAGYRAFGERLADGGVTLDDWHAHLTTLFPEVRPRGYLEVRSADAILPEHYVAPVALLSGLAYHAPSLYAACELLGAPDAALLARADEVGLGDAGIARAALPLCEIALAGCAALGDKWMSGEELERARAILECRLKES